MVTTDRVIKCKNEPCDYNAAGYCISQFVEVDREGICSKAGKTTDHQDRRIDLGCSKCPKDGHCEMSSKNINHRAMKDECLEKCPVLLTYEGKMKP